VNGIAAAYTDDYGQAPSRAAHGKAYHFVALVFFNRGRFPRRAEHDYCGSTVFRVRIDEPSEARKIYFSVIAERRYKRNHRAF
jgi:hypothetical protein